MAGMPKLVLDSAKNKLKLMERNKPNEQNDASKDGDFQLSFDVEDPRCKKLEK